MPDARGFGFTRIHAEKTRKRHGSSLLCACESSLSRHDNKKENPCRFRSIRVIRVKTDPCYPPVSALMGVSVKTNPCYPPLSVLMGTGTKTNPCYPPMSVLLRIMDDR